MGTNSTPDRDSISDRLGEGIVSIRSSSLLILAVFGVVLILLGATVLDGVFAGMFGIWGTTAILVGLLGHLMHHYIYS